MTGQFKVKEVQEGLPAFNFGDVLGIEILKHVARKRFAYGAIKIADIFVTGTVGQLIEMHGGAKEGAVIAGIGTDPTRETKIDWQGTYDVRMVRGPLTRELWRLPKEIPMGDPGLLAREVYGEVEKRYTTGHVRHFKDRTPIPDHVANDPNAIVIEAAGAPADVIPLIAACNQISTSSLHGAIVADSYGIPWSRHGAPVGLGRKWEDYSLALEERGIERLKSDITDVLSVL
ncbi:hypothetical protein [Microbacterium sp. ZKA21]|uniref:hypothetical protein n=1 Tax=Microbacterium sp. ZKA21 TaxID=3381694 RepID=UPI003D250D95